MAIGGIGGGTGIERTVGGLVSRRSETVSDVASVLPAIGRKSFTMAKIPGCFLGRCKRTQIGCSIVVTSLVGTLCLVYHSSHSTTETAFMVNKLNKP